MIDYIALFYYTQSNNVGLCKPGYLRYHTYCGTGLSTQYTTE